MSMLRLRPSFSESYKDIYSVIKTWSFGPVANPATRGSESLGYADIGSYLNPKHEIRNPKQYPMIQIRMIKTRPWRYKFKHYV